MQIVATVKRVHHVGSVAFPDVSHSSTFYETSTLGEIDRWAKSIDSKFTFSSIQFSMLDEEVFEESEDK